jgi:dihydroflavonol-4-reductase
MKKVFLTGADGLLGSNLTRELLNRGYAVRVFLEKGRNTGTLDGLDIERITGNLLNSSDLQNAVPGCNYLIHAAASTAIWPTRSEIIRKVNITGTQNVINAAIECHIEKMIHVGTANSFGSGTKENPGDETRPFNGEHFRLDYIDSKYQAHNDILEAVRERRLPAVIVNPTFMIGPYDSTPSSGTMVMSVATGKVPGYTRGGKNYVYVKDVAAGIVNALDRGVVGECYILGNKNLSYGEAFSLMADTLNVKKPRIYFPPAVSMTYALICTLIYRITGKPPQISISMAKSSNEDCYYTAAKAVKQLDLPQTDISFAVRECHEWLLKNGYYKK